jgi:spermidine/putrescine transport system permease protein
MGEGVLPSPKFPKLFKNKLVLPGLVWISLFLLIPCLIVFTYSFFERGVYGGIEYNFNLENYTRSFKWTYFKILLTSSQIAFIAASVSVLIGFPAAYFITKFDSKIQIFLLFFIMLPFWSNYLIRTYSWMVLLNNQGLINNALIQIGIIEEPIRMLYTKFSVIVGLVYNYLPFVILSIYASLSTMNKEIIEASEDLGGNFFNTLFRIIVPMCLSGIVAGFIFVFVLSIGNFITPDLLGGGRFLMIGNLIYDQFLSARDWPFGSSLSLILVIIMLSLLFLQSLILARKK